MTSKITVMTYNVRYANPNDGEYVWDRRRDEVASVLRFHGPDVVGLQEVNYDQLQDLRERLPGYEWLAAGREESGNAGEYAAVGYDKDRFNLEADEQFWLSEAPTEPGSVGWDAKLARLVRYVRLREYDTGVELYHFNTHFDHYGETARLESAKLLRDRIDETATNTPAVVTGDFNCRQGTAPYHHLTERTKSSRGRALFDAHRTTRQPHHGPVTTMTDFRSLIPDKKIDHVFVTSEIEVIQHGVCSDSFGNGEYPSDHMPVRTILSFPEYI